MTIIFIVIALLFIAWGYYRHQCLLKLFFQ